MGNQSFNEDRKQNLNYADSWLQNSVELAALGAIVTGAGALAVKGDFGGAIRTGQRAFGAAGKGFENYLKRNGNAGTRLGYNVGKKTFLNLRKMPKTDPNAGAQFLEAQFDKSIAAVDAPEVQEKIRREVARRMGNQATRNLVDDALDGTNRAGKRNTENQARTLFEKVRAEEISHRVKGTPSPLSRPSGDKKKNDETKKSLFTAKNIAQEATAAGVTGLAFGAGISGFHALDRLSADPQNQKKLEDTFGYAGSFLKKEDDRKMNKQAGSLELYNSLKGLGKKTPEAIMGGIGFTGVSLATAKAMNGQDPRKPAGEDGDPDSTRVIIELGNPTKRAGDQINSTPLGLAGLPQLAGARSTDMEKTAFAPLNSLRQFGRDFKGYGEEIQNLRSQNPADIAAERLKGEDISSLVQNTYGNLAEGDHNENSFRKNLFDSYTNQAKNDLDDQVRTLETQTANARLKAGAGTLAAGGGLAGLAAMKSGREEQNPNGFA